MHRIYARGARASRAGLAPALRSMSCSGATPKSRASVVPGQKRPRRQRAACRLRRDFDDAGGAMLGQRLEVAGNLCVIASGNIRLAAGHCGQRPLPARAPWTAQNSRRPELNIIRPFQIIGGHPARLASRPPVGPYTAAIFPISDVIPSRTFSVVRHRTDRAGCAGFSLRAPPRRLLSSSFSSTTRLVPVSFSWADVIASMFLPGGWTHFWATCCI